MTNTIKESNITDSAITTAKLADSAVTNAKITGNINFKNIIINGDMRVAQRATSFTGLGNGDTGYHTCDRWKFFESGSPTCQFTQTQDTDVPTGQGFANSMKFDCTTAQGSLASNDLFRLMQIFEGQNLQYLKYGTANAQSLTASFWVKSNVTGDYNTHLFSDGATFRIISSTFTINSADTWEKKTITYAGDTAQAIINDNQGRLLFTITLLSGTDYTSTDATSWGTYSNGKLAYGQVANIASSTANNFWITGLQLEAGTTASDFEFLPYDVNLQRCLRYYEVIAKGNSKDISFGATYATNTMACLISYSYKRTPPSLDITSGTNYYKIYTGSNNYMNDLTASQPSNTRVLVYNNTDISLADNISGWVATSNASAYIAFDAEL